MPDCLKVTVVCALRGVYVLAKAPRVLLIGRGELHHVTDEELLPVARSIAERQGIAQARVEITRSPTDDLSCPILIEMYPTAFGPRDHFAAWPEDRTAEERWPELALGPYYEDD